MRAQRLNISIREHSQNANFERFVDFAQALVKQHPDVGLDYVEKKLSKYMAFMKFNQSQFRMLKRENHITLALGNAEIPKAIIYCGKEADHELA